MLALWDSLTMVVVIFIFSLGYYEKGVMANPYT